LYVYSELISGIRKISRRKYENEISSRDNKIDTLILQNTNIIHRLESLEKSHEETNIKLKDINNKLDKALPDRNVDPVDKELKHQYILFKNKLIDINI